MQFHLAGLTSFCLSVLVLSGCGAVSSPPVATQEAAPKRLEEMLSLANALLQKKKYGEAEDAYRQLLTEPEAVDKPQVAAEATVNLAHCYHEQGKLADAEPFYVKYLEYARANPGQGNAQLLGAMNYLANNVYKRGKLKQAAQHYWQVVQLSAGGDTDRTATLAATTNLANAYYCQGRYGDAEPLYGKVLFLRKENGHSSEEIAWSMVNLANSFQRQGKSGQANPLYVRALELFDNTTFPGQIDVVIDPRRKGGLLAASRYPEPLYTGASDQGMQLTLQQTDAQYSLMQLARALRSRQRTVEARKLDLMAGELNGAAVSSSTESGRATGSP